MLLTPKDLVVRTIERETPATTTLTLGHDKYSKKRPDSLVFTDDVDLIFKS